MTKIVIETSIGQLQAELFPNKAPLTTAFFLGLLNDEHYSGGDIYRSTRLGVKSGPFLLQGGTALPFLQGHKPTKRAPMLEAIETTGMTGLNHKRGSLSLARDLASTGHALAEFFICLGEFPSIDENGDRAHDTRGFPVFGEVVSGLEVLDKAASRDTRGFTNFPLLKGEILSEQIQIVRIYTLE